VSGPDLERLEIRAAITREYEELVEYRTALAMQSAQWMLLPRVTLVDEQRRIVRVVNAPEEARSNPPRLLSHHWTDAYSRGTTEPVGKFHRQSSPRDLDDVLFPTSGGDELFALVADDAAPSVVVRRFTNGGSGLLTSFDTPADDLPSLSG
jgi:hypothetical protein